ncbi:hypothetical protein EUX98_g2629 [Antrodiella citrinella]|uniref:Potassium transport protein n=1 Tax=Antrodiella citrinella TaxID=2447956 RepID=A0A4S4N0S9_9APHY|nr:hypothetical protein EUX98_g2629 [Antrodiella citrinella]
MPVVSTLEDVYAWLKRELNFFRVHLLFFLFVPLVSAAIFWGANGRFQISFVDALFLCYSALSVTGLSTVNLSTCTAFQQAILFFLMCIGNTTVVAWVMVLTRKRYFRSHLEMLQMKEHSKRKIADRLTKHLHLPRRGRAADARTRGRDPDSKPTNGKFYVEEGIGAALVGGGSAGIGMGIGLGRPIPRRQLTVYQPSQLSKAEIESQLGFRAKDQGQGGFPGPIELSEELARRFHLSSLISWIGEQFKLQHNPRMQRLTKDFENLIIGRNSDFNTEELTDEELEELGGLEYRALRLLSYLVAFYFVGTQLFAFILIAPWLSTTHEYDDVFAAQPRLVNKSWFVAFQIVGSYTGGGMSLVDEGMVPFQRAYLMIFSMIFAILAGNHGLPILWIMTKFVRDDSTADKTLHFLLDHPRRCFLYLFPSHVTWFLVATLVIFTGFEWVAFIVLDIGLEVLKSLPPGIQALSGLFQSFAVRASGFPIVALSELAPSFQFLCIVMMYIAVYPVAMSIRSTNVYEEQSLGVFEAEPEDSDEEPALGESQGSRSERISKYFGWHLRRQVAYDIWWLVWGIFANYSFSGAFGPLSKLVVIVIMLRGRHRGLPVAVDRAILLPADMVLTSNPSTFDPRSPSRLPTTAPTSYVHTPEKGRSPTTSPGLDRRVYSREGPQPNMMDLVHDMNHIAAPQVIPETKDTNPNGDWQQSSEPKDYEV